MASYRTVKTGAAPTASARGENGCPSARPDTAVSGGGAMKRAALYARVSTDKQEREETIDSQLDALYHAGEGGAYEIPPGGGFWEEPSSGARCGRSPLDH